MTQSRLAKLKGAVKSEAERGRRTSHPAQMSFVLASCPQRGRCCIREANLYQQLQISVASTAILTFCDCRRNGSALWQLSHGRDSLHDSFQDDLLDASDWHGATGRRSCEKPSTLPHAPPQSQNGVSAACIHQRQATFLPFGSIDFSCVLATSLRCMKRLGKLSQAQALSRCSAYLRSADLGNAYQKKQTRVQQYRHISHC